MFKILVYEIGTGTCVGEIDQLNPISFHRFSSDGSFLMAGTNEGLFKDNRKIMKKLKLIGLIYIWILNAYLLENINSMLTAMSGDINYWKNYPIYLEEF